MAPSYASNRIVLTLPLLNTMIHASSQSTLILRTSRHHVGRTICSMSSSPSNSAMLSLDPTLSWGAESITQISLLGAGIVHCCVLEDAHERSAPPARTSGCLKSPVRGLFLSPNSETATIDARNVDLGPAASLMGTRRNVRVDTSIAHMAMTLKGTAMTPELPRPISTHVRVLMFTPPYRNE